MVRVGVAGAGLLGRLLAWRLSRAGHQVEVFDPAPGAAPRFDGQGAAAFTAAGMLSPLAELEHAESAVARLGWRSIDLWAGIVPQLPGAVDFQHRGSLLLAHRSDRGAAERVLARIGCAGAGASWIPPRALPPAELGELEPAVHGPAHAWLLEGEACIDAPSAMQALFDGAEGVVWHWGLRVESVRPGELQVQGEPAARAFDVVIDVRGLGARPELPLRGVRGETVWLHAPGLSLRRPVRLLHPRHRVYVVPRPDDVVLIGASEIESEDRSPVSLKSAVELMSAAQSVLPALAEARILRLDRNLRPALPDNAPQIQAQDGLLRINGLYRHGWLLAPALVQDALAALHLPEEQTA